MLTNWHIMVGVLAGIIQIGIFYPYMASILRGPTKPNVVSWAGWAFLACVATLVQFSEGASWSIIIPLFATISSVSVAVIALRTGHAQITKFEITCITLGVIAFTLWYVADQPLLSLLFIILADLMVSIPTIWKTYQKPETEPHFIWFFYTTSALLALFATTKFDVYNLLYPTFVTLIALIITALAFRGKLGKNR